MNVAAASAATDLIGRFETYIINPAILLVFTAGFLYFLWGLVVFLSSLGAGGTHEEGKKHMLYGLAGMLIMVSVYGILALLSDTFGLGCDPAKKTCNFDTSRMKDVTLPARFLSN